jgi:hypothetical protein
MHQSLKTELRRRALAKVVNFIQTHLWYEAHGVEFNFIRIA